MIHKKLCDSLIQRKHSFVTSDTVLKIFKIKEKKKNKLRQSIVGKMYTGVMIFARSSVFQRIVRGNSLGLRATIIISSNIFLLSTIREL